ncbi:uncharacterized protein LOC108904442 [Anoplophora glabripennis]|uniref:uncharacterized protein LOC108904442 n=1 Tax=Anoplophora glabripennis TaxID=217634 RepID=UPI000874C485|nr:uncharacterized protein LOC108904442 [Anoplophora glabripennis]
MATIFFGFRCKAKLVHTSLFRNYVTIAKRELEVPTFCDVHINLPYNLVVKPLNIHKYHNLDKLIIQVHPSIEQNVEHDIDGNQVKIFNNKEVSHDIPNDIFCSVKAPVKANVYVNSEKDISIGYFHGDKLHLNTNEGNIFIDKFQGTSVNLKTNNGNIRLKEFIQASTITAEILNSGSISSGRLQGLDLKLKTNKGNISVESAYSYKSLFEVGNGNLDLHNIHKTCTILLKKGYMYLAGFDGGLDALIENGHADIQLARVTKDSEINLQNGALNLKLADACQDYVQFKIQAKDCDVAENIKSTINRLGDVIILTPDINEDNTVSVSCVNGAVNVESASWQDMIKLKLKK